MSLFLLFWASDFASKSKQDTQWGTILAHLVSKQPEHKEFFGTAVYFNCKVRERDFGPS